MKLQSLPCYCSTVRQAARAATALYEEVLAEAGVHATQFGARQLIESAPKLTTTAIALKLAVCLAATRLASSQATDPMN